MLTQEKIKTKGRNFDHITVLGIGSTDSTLDLALEGDHSPIGTGSISKVTEFVENVLYERWVQLTPCGKVRLLFVVTNLAEDPAPPTHFSAPESDMVYFSKLKRSEFTTGDLLLFSNNGPLGVYSKLIQFTQFSSVGMVVNLPDAYSGELLPFVFELSQNTSHIPDYFAKQELSCIPMLTPLPSRVCGHRGGAVWHMKAIPDICSESSEKEIVNYVYDTWEFCYSSLREIMEKKRVSTGKTNTYFSETVPFEKSHLKALEQWGISESVRRSYADLLCPGMIAKALSKSFKFYELPQTARALVASGAFLPARLLRVPKRQLEAKEVMNVLIEPKTVGTSPVFEPREITLIPTKPPPLPKVFRVCCLCRHVVRMFILKS